jgi:hypothetical protein
LVKETILFWLTHKIECLPLSCLAALLAGADPKRTARRLFRELEQDRYVSLECVLAPVIESVVPLFEHDPNDPKEHDWQSLAHRLDRRDQKIKTELVASATERACAEFGGSLSGDLRSVDVSHAVRTAHVFLSLESDQCDWISEPELISRGLWLDQKNVPDAALVSGPRMTLIETCGKYPASKLSRRAKAWGGFPYRLY